MLVGVLSFVKALAMALHVADRRIVSDLPNVCDVAVVTQDIGDLEADDTLWSSFVTVSGRQIDGAHGRRSTIYPRD